MEKIVRELVQGLNRFYRNFFARHVILVHTSNNRPEVEVQGILSVHLGKFAAERRVKKLRARRPEGVTFQFIALELGRVKTPYCFDEWLPEYVSPSWMRLKRSGRV